MAALCNFNSLASWRNAENGLQSVNLTIPKKEIQLLMTAEQIARAQEMSTNLFNRINTPPTK